MTHSPATRAAASMRACAPRPARRRLHEAAAVAARPAAVRDGAGAGLCDRVPDRPGPKPTGATVRRARTGATG